MAPKSRSNERGGATRPRLCVLAGGPCAGKTSLLRALAQRRVPVVPEAFSAMLDQGFDGRRLDIAGFHLAIARRQRAAETAALQSRPHRLVFCDRGLGDPLGYMLHHGHAPPQHLVDMLLQALQRYRVVFLLDLNPRYRRKPSRPESRSAAEHIHRCIETVYREAGARLVRLPWGPVAWRAEAMLSLARRGPEARLPARLAAPR